MSRRWFTVRGVPRSEFAEVNESILAFAVGRPEADGSEFFDLSEILEFLAARIVAPAINVEDVGALDWFDRHTLLLEIQRAHPETRRNLAATQWMLARAGAI